MTTEFPKKYLNVLDTIYEQESFAAKYQVDGAEFVGAKTVMVPELVIEDGTAAYNRFDSEDGAELHYTAYTLDQDREKQFYIDAIEDEDEAHLRQANVAKEFYRTKFIPEVDVNFFSKVKASAKTVATANLTSSNIKKELRKVRKQMKNAGISRADLYMTSDALGCLEDATNRQWSNEGEINDMVGKYDIFDIYEVPEARMPGSDFAAIGQNAKADNAIRHIMKRAVSYIFAPGQHTKGDGWLSQFRWVYGDVAWKNKNAALYVNVNPSDKSTISAFSITISSTDYEGEIDQEAKTIDIEVPAATVITSCVINYEASEDATVKQGNTKIVSGTTAISFTSGTAKTFKCIAEDGSSATEYAVTVTVASA